MGYSCSLDILPISFDGFALLIEWRGNVAGKDEIPGKVRDGSFAEEGNLAVSTLQDSGFLRIQMGPDQFEKRCHGQMVGIFSVRDKV